MYMMSWFSLAEYIVTFRLKGLYVVPVMAA